MTLNGTDLSWVQTDVSDETFCSTQNASVTFIDWWYSQIRHPLFPFPTHRWHTNPSTRTLGPLSSCERFFFSLVRKHPLRVPWYQHNWFTLYHVSWLSQGMVPNPRAILVSCSCLFFFLVVFGFHHGTPRFVSVRNDSRSLNTMEVYTFGIGPTYTRKNEMDRGWRSRGTTK